MGEHHTPPPDPAPLTADTAAAANTTAGGAAESTAAANPAAHAFISRWQHITASELATAQSFVIDLCALLDVDKPHPTPEQHYMFERPVTFSHGDGSSSAGRIDCYKRGHFVLEAKKLKSGAHTKGFDDGLLRAWGLPFLAGIDAATDAILTHLVTLNAQRAAEEAAGTVRWLRPAFQNVDKSLSKPELPAQIQQWLDDDLASLLSG